MKPLRAACDTDCRPTMRGHRLSAFQRQFATVTCHAGLRDMAKFQLPRSNARRKLVTCKRHSSVDSNLGHKERVITVGDKTRIRPGTLPNNTAGICTLAGLKCGDFASSCVVKAVDDQCTSHAVKRVASVMLRAKC